VFRIIAGIIGALLEIDKFIDLSTENFSKTLRIAFGCAKWIQ